MKERKEIKITNEITSSRIEKKSPKRLLWKNIIFVLISEYGWLLIVLMTVFLGFYYPYYHPAQTYFSKNATVPWDSDYTPKIFMHISDIHISFYLSSRANGSINFFSDFLNYNPDFIINSGDVVDSYEESDWPKVGSQWPGDWGIYLENIRKNLSRYKIIDVAGNHDLFAIDSLLSPNNYFINHSFTFNRSNTKTYDDFIVRKIELFNETFILYNEYIFPTTHPPYGVSPHPTRHMLDLLEKEVDSSGECFILTHYEVDRNWFVTSSKGHTYKEIMSKRNIKAIFTGHDHPPRTMVIHHGQGGVEYCTPTPFKGKTQGLVTIDNGQMVYHYVKIVKKGEKPLFFMSYPIPNEQISSHHTFNYKEFEIRIISYAGKKVNLEITGDIKGKMQFKKTLKNGADLYVYPVNLDFGNYTIHVTGGGCNITRKFVIGNKFKGYKELSICFLRSLLILRICFIPIFIAIYIIIFPWFGNLEIASKLENIIEGKDYRIKQYNIKDYFILVFLLLLFGPFIMRERYKLINSSTKYIMFFFSLYPLIFPSSIFKPIYGVHGYSFLCFIVIGKRIQFDEWALQLNFGYYFTIILYNAIFISAFKYYSFRLGNLLIYFINFLISYGFLGGGLYLNIRFIGESIWWPYLFLTPIYVLIPLFLKYIIHFRTYIVNMEFKASFKRLEEEEISKNNKINIKEII